MNSEEREFLLMTALCNLNIARDIMKTVLDNVPKDSPEREKAEGLSNVIDIATAKVTNSPGKA